MPAATASAAPSSATRPRAVCHGSAGGPEPEPPGEVLRDRRAGVAERGERPGGAAELRVEPRPQQAGARVERRVEPAGGLEPERDRERLLEQRPARHRGGGVLTRERRAGARDGVELLDDERPRAARDEHRRGVDDVLARRAVVHVLGMLRADALAERRDERDDRRARGDGRLAQRGRVDAAGAGDRRGRRRGDHARLRLRRRERRLGLQHRRHPGARGHRLAEAGGREERAEELAHGASRRTAPTTSFR